MVARESGQYGHRTGTAEVDLANVHLEQLPAYEAAEEVERVILAPIPLRPGERDNGVAGVRSVDESPKPEERTPDEPPPGYEETQVQAVGANLDERLRAEDNELDPTRR